MVKIAVTGHRPGKLGGYQATENFKAIRRHMRDFLTKAPDGELFLLSGGALGIDQFWIEVGLHLDLPVIAALPFEGYDERWPINSRRKYAALLDKCYEVVYVSEPGYHPAKLQTRNEYLVNNSDVLTAYWNGEHVGGTANCVDFAMSVGKQVNVFNPNDIINLAHVDKFS